MTAAERELREALFRYGQHTRTCDYVPCSCGLTLLKRRYPRPKPPKNRGAS